jgi:GNAT superfamily N-acetyltransferase
MLRTGGTTKSELADFGQRNEVEPNPRRQCPTGAPQRIKHAVRENKETGHMTHNEMLATAHRALALSPPPYLRHQKLGKFVRHEGMAFTRQDLPGPGFNFVAVLNEAPPLDRVLELAREFYSGCAHGYGILVDADAGHPIEAELRARGWQIAEDEPALVMPTIPPAPALPTGLTIERAADEAGLGVFCDVVNVAFGVPPEMAAMFAFPVGYVTDPEMSYLVGFCDSKAAAAAMFYLTGGVAAVGGVATLPEYRRRGFGKALTWAALAEGVRHGCTSGALRALGVSYDMYRRMGFVPVCKHRTYIEPAKRV